MSSQVVMRVQQTEYLWRIRVKAVFPHCRKVPICRKFYRKKKKFRMKEIRRKSMKPQEKRGIFIYSPTHVSPVWPIVWPDCEQSS